MENQNFYTLNLANFNKKRVFIHVRNMLFTKKITCHRWFAVFLLQRMPYSNFSSTDSVGVFCLGKKLKRLDQAAQNMTKSVKNRVVRLCHNHALHIYTM